MEMDKAADEILNADIELPPVPPNPCKTCPVLKDDGGCGEYFHHEDCPKYVKHVACLDQRRDDMQWEIQRLRNAGSRLQTRIRGESNYGSKLAMRLQSILLIWLADNLEIIVVKSMTNTNKKGD